MLNNINGSKLNFNKDCVVKLFVDKNNGCGLPFNHLLNTGMYGTAPVSHCGIFTSGAQKGCRDGQEIYRILAAALHTLCSTSRHFAESIEQECVA
jgi:hypothetical protein